MSRIVTQLVRTATFLREKGLNQFAWILTYMIRILFACHVSPGAKLGSGTILAYGGLGIVIHGGVIIGERCTIGTNVTIGGNFGKCGVPAIGDDCYIATGAKVFGNITIGNRVLIGANAVVTRSVPDDVIIGGICCDIISNASNKLL